MNGESRLVVGASLGSDVRGREDLPPFTGLKDLSLIFRLTIWRRIRYKILTRVSMVQYFNLKQRILAVTTYILTFFLTRIIQYILHARLYLLG